MTKPIDDEQVEAAFSAWARDSLASAGERGFSVADAHIGRPRQRRSRIQRLMPALAAVAVVVLVTAGLLIRGLDRQQASSVTSTAQCPHHVPSLAGKLPSRAEPLFGRPVSGLIACSYAGQQRPQLIAAVRLPEPLATVLVHHLDDAPARGNDPLLCLTTPNFSVLLARDAQNNPLTPITIVPGCRQIAASNGRTTRYLDTSDPAFRQAEHYVQDHK